MRGVGRAQGRQNIPSVSTGGRRMGNQEAPDLEAELLTADRVGQSRKRTRAYACTLDKGGDHRLARQRRAPEDKRVQHRRIDGMRANECPAHVDGQARRSSQVVDGLSDALRVDGSDAWSSGGSRACRRACSAAASRRSASTRPRWVPSIRCTVDDRAAAAAELYRPIATPSRRGSVAPSSEP
jgi:hypothetical protein